MPEEQENPVEENPPPPLPTPVVPATSRIACPFDAVAQAGALLKAYGHQPRYDGEELIVDGADIDLAAIVGDVNALAAEGPKHELRARLAARRWDVETGGIVVSVAGEPVQLSTARGDDRAALDSIYAALRDELRPEGAAFKFADGISRSVSNADMMAACLAALAHVQHCFNVEGHYQALIATEELTTPGEIDAIDWEAALS